MLRLLPLLMMQVLIILCDSCQRARDRDNRVSVSCVNQNLSDLPHGIDTDAQTLLLSGNSLRSLSWSNFGQFPGIHWIDLSDNLIHTLQPAGPVLPNLSVLRLSGNHLTALGELDFRSLPRLTEIYLDRNQIFSLHEATFSELPYLEVINLSQNKLSNLPPRLLERISSTSLKTFNLQNNSVSLMPEGFFSSKPELPYVYLSLNSWTCNCSITYLHAFLNDQEHNIYKHEGPNNIIVAAETVVCSGPPHLVNRPIIELEEDDFCPQNPPTIKGDGDVQPDQSNISIKPNSFTLTPNDHLKPGDIPPYSTHSWSSSGKSWVLESWTQNLSEYWVESEEVVSADFEENISSSYNVAWHATVQTSLRSQSEDSTRISKPKVPSTTEPSIASSSQAEMLTFQEKKSQTATLSTKTLSQMEPTGSLQSLPPTESLTNVPDLFKTETLTGVLISSQPGPNVVTEIPSRTSHTSAAGAHYLDTLSTDVRVFPWCLWVFSSFILLCVLSALVSLALVIWLLRIHLTVFRPLKRYSHSSDIILRSFRCTESIRKCEHKDARVSFVPLEQIRDVQAVFRSVLFIDQREKHLETGGVGSQSAAEEVEITSGNVFRKTIYRMFSREEEVPMWRDEEQGAGSELTAVESSAHYSLILREDRGEQRPVQWLIGEWEMNRGVWPVTDPDLFVHPEALE